MDNFELELWRNKFVGKMVKTSGGSVLGVCGKIDQHHISIADNGFTDAIEVLYHSVRGGSGQFGTYVKDLFLVDDVR